MNNNIIPFALALLLCQAGMPQPLGWAYTDRGQLVNITEPLQYPGNICCAAPSFEHLAAIVEDRDVDDETRTRCESIIRDFAD